MAYTVFNHHMYLTAAMAANLRSGVLGGAGYSYADGVVSLVNRNSVFEERQELSAAVNAECDSLMAELTQS